MAATNINYVSTYLEFSLLTNVHGEQTYKSIQEIKDKMKAINGTVKYNLGR